VSWPHGAWGVAGLLVAAGEATQSITSILIGLLGTTTIAAAIGWWRNRNKDKVDLTAAVASVNETSLKVMGDSMSMVKQVQDQLETVRIEQAQTQKRLSVAMERIAHLEGELKGAREDRERLLHQLLAAREERDGLQAQMDHLREQVAVMERATKRPSS
jgi:septal ring factor EnvC (AmiA/AmiB activator)